MAGITVARTYPMTPLRDVVLAVHGIGDQSRNSTILSTIIRFCDHHKYPGIVSLGAFYESLTQPDPAQPPIPAYVVEAPPERSGLTGTMGFSEIHWAALAREISEDGYILQETKAWAATIVNRMRVMAENSPGGHQQNVDYPRIRQVLREMIRAISVIEALLFVARKAGIVDFDLRKLLDGYLGDVQMVAEFASLRRKIVGRFHESMRCAHLAHPDARIHVVAHSEGTVVAFLGLLEAIQDPVAHPWISSVRGFMTLGSPIDKHLILWPELFRDFRSPAYAPSSFAHKIWWVNYVDYGDPVGFELDTAREWLAERGFDRVFRFEAKDDFVFGRYLFPGKAHTDYWMDSEVFSHFIEHAGCGADWRRQLEWKLTMNSPNRYMTLPLPESEFQELQQLAGRPLSRPGPSNKAWARVCSTVTAYLIPLGIIWLAAYVFYLGLVHYLYPEGRPPGEKTASLVVVLGSTVGLLAGTTVWLRLAELSRHWSYKVVGAVIYAFTAGLFWFGLRTSAANESRLVAWLNELPQTLLPTYSFPLAMIGASLLLVAVTLSARHVLHVLKTVWASLGRLGAVAIPLPPSGKSHGAAKASSASIPAPAVSRMRTMMLLGAAGLGANIVFDLYVHRGEERGPLWIVILTALAFLYLWRLAAAFFDLSFVWHRYIRGGVALTYLRDLDAGKKREMKG